MANKKITEVTQVSSVASTDDLYIKTGPDFRRVPVSKLEELIAPAEVTLSGSTVTIAEAQNNTVYVCGEVSSLTVTARATGAAFTLIFDSPGGTPTSLTMPSSNVIMPTGFTGPDVLTHYEINVDKRGYAVVAAWSFD